MTQWPRAVVGSCRSSPSPRRDRRRMIRRLSFFYLCEFSLSLSLSLSLYRVDILSYISSSHSITHCKLTFMKAILGMLSSRRGSVLILMEWSWKDDGSWSWFVVKLFSEFIWWVIGLIQQGIVYGACDSWHTFVYGKDGFAQVSINLARYTDQKIILFDYQNYMRRSNWLVEY